MADCKRPMSSRAGPRDVARSSRRRRPSMPAGSSKVRHASVDSISSSDNSRSKHINTIHLIPDPNPWGEVAPFPNGFPHRSHRDGVPFRGDASSNYGHSADSIRSKVPMPCAEAPVFSSKAIAAMFHDLRTALEDLSVRLSKAEMKVDTLTDKIEVAMGQLHRKIDGVDRSCSRLQSVISIKSELADSSVAATNEPVLRRSKRRKM